MAQIRLLTDVFGNDLESTVDREQRQGDGSPEGVVEARIGDLYRDLSGPALYLKQTGDGTKTGWGLITGGGEASIAVTDDGDPIADATTLNFVPPLTATDGGGGTVDIDADIPDPTQIIDNNISATCNDGAGTFVAAATGNVTFTLDRDENSATLSLPGVGGSALFSVQDQFVIGAGSVTLTLDSGGDAAAILQWADGQLIADPQGFTVTADFATSGAIGFNGAAPTAQSAPIANASGGVVIDAEARTALNTLLIYLRLRGDIDT